MCCKNIVYDVTSARDFYGPEGPYANFAGRDASRALALMSLKIEDVENTDLSDLNEEQLNVLNDWERKFKSKYKIVGRYQAREKERKRRNIYIYIYVPVVRISR